MSGILIGQNAIFVIFVLSKIFKNSNFSFSFCHFLTSVYLDKQCHVQKYCFSFMVFHIEIGFTDITVSLTRKCIQCNAKSTSLYLLKMETFIPVSLISVDYRW